MKVSILIAYFKITSYQCRIVFTQRLSLFRLQIQSPFVSLKCTWEDKKSQNACKSYTSFSYFWMLLAVLGDTQETAGECKRENDRFFAKLTFFWYSSFELHGRKDRKYLSERSKTAYS